MTREVSAKESKEAILRDGAFSALVGFVERGDFSPKDGSYFLGKIFEYYLHKLREAQTEVRRIDTVLQRMVQICESGKAQRPWQSRDPRVLQLAHEMTTFDGWVISLYETNLTMLGVGNPQRGREKVHEMARSMDALWAKREQELNVGLKAPELFKLA